MRFRCRHLMLAVGLLWMAAPAVVQAAHLGGSTGHPAPGTILTEDVRNTLHNLSDTISGFNNPNINPAAGVGREVCVFCHTPHGSNTGPGTFPGPAPLWNRLMPTTANYTLYTAPNMDSTATGPVGVSMACLSCHDGTVALDALINAPLSGGFRSGNLGTSAAGPGTSVGLLLDNTDFMQADFTMEDATRTDTGTNYATIVTGAAPFPNLQRNIGDDHPISMAMPTATDPQFALGLPVSSPLTSTVDGNINKLTRSYTYADKRDAVRLYPASGGSTGPGTWVECASCHNPHAPRPLFLRLPSPLDSSLVGGTITSATLIPASWGGNGTTKWSEDPNWGSAVCLTCHEK